MAERFIPPRGPHSRRLQAAWDGRRTSEQRQLVAEELRELSRLLAEAADALERDDSPTYTNRLMAGLPLMRGFVEAVERGIVLSLRAAQRDAGEN